MRAGDCVRHRPTGEKWRVAYVRGDHLAWCGWPPGEALVSDCDILELCSDEEHASALASWANNRGQVESGDRRREVCAAQLVALANSVSATLGRTPLSGVQLAFDVLAEALDAGGYSAGRIVERLRESGVAVTVSDLHGHGLQAVANAISDASTVDDLEAKRAELQERVDVAESKADACEQEMHLAHSRIRAVADSACTSHMLDWSPEDIRKGLSCAEADRCSACRCQDFLNGKPDTDLDTALSLLRRVIAPLECEDEADFGATKADALDTEIVALLARHPAPEVGS